jgi:hypothetical protein
MTDVYSNSSLNFAAADSPDGETGCFFDDRRELSLNWQVTFPHNGPGLPAGTPNMHTWTCTPTSRRAVIEQSQLASRAWTLQERLLPPRTLYFGLDQIAWECREGNVYEAFPDEFNICGLDLSPGNLFILPEQANFPNYKRQFFYWSDIVNNYSERNLTFSRDKLVAISGLVRILAPMYGMDYVAGLWVKELFISLNWYKKSSNLSAARDVTTIYRAPSWSWASVDGSVCYLWRHYSLIEGGRGTRNEDRERSPLTKVLGTSSLLKTSAMFYLLCFTILYGHIFSRDARLTSICRSRYNLSRGSIW